MATSIPGFTSRVPVSPRGAPEFGYTSTRVGPQNKHCFLLVLWKVESERKILTKYNEVGVKGSEFGCYKIKFSLHVK